MTDPAAAVERAGAPQLIVLAGSNGAGKTTFHDERLAPSRLPFVNADLIARALVGPGSPAAITDAISRRAAGIADALREQHVARRESFVTETVFSDPAGAKLRFLANARERGYFVTLMFIGLESAAVSQGRVLSRVAKGGHDVPPERIAARYPRTLANLARALPQVDAALLYDNSDATEPYRFVARWRAGKPIVEAWLPEWYRQARGRAPPATM